MDPRHPRHPGQIFMDQGYPRHPRYLADINMLSYSLVFDKKINSLQMF